MVMSVYDSNYASWFLMLCYMQDGGIVSVPQNFHERCVAVKKMLSNDASGIVNSLTSFGINSASEVTYHVESNSSTLAKNLNAWLKNLNMSNLGQIPVGINALSKEYFRERWGGSSLCIVKMEWEEVNGYILPTSMWLMDGSRIYIKPTNGQVAGNFSYYLDNKFKQPLSGDYIVQKPYARWFDGYPDPYLISTGVYRNFYG